MALRTDLHSILVAALGSNNVYFQPPSSLLMNYPCIVYKRNSASSYFADNSLYMYEKEYQVTVIDRDPDSGIPDKISKLPKCSFERHFVADNLNHDVFNLFF